MQRHSTNKQSTATPYHTHFYVAAKVNHGWEQCVYLCPHEGGAERPGAQGVWSESPSRQFDRAEHSPIPAKLSNMEYKVKEDCYVNFEHTVACSLNRVCGALGTVEDKKNLIEVYQMVQESMYENQIQAITAGDE